MSYKQSLWHGAAVGAMLGAALLAPGSAAAQSSQDLSVQVDQLRQQVEQLKQQLQLQPPPAPTPDATGSFVAQTNGHAPLPNGAVQLGGVRLQLGGFIEEASIYRSRNEVADIGSDYNTGIPFKNNVLAHENEWRQSARQSRIAGLVSGDVNEDTHLAAYIETDFLSASASSNDRESNSYSLRVRHAYSTLDKDDWGLHILAGQNWSLLTTNTAGIIPRQEQIPLTIDAQYVVGFNWKRQAQVRIVENWGNVWAGISFEDPEASLPPGVNTTGIASPNANNNGNPGGLLNPNTQYSNNFMPDIVAKLAADPGWGHYELKGLVRGFSDNLGATTNEVVGYAGGAAATMPIVPKYVDLQISGLAGYGIGTYGSGQLPDVAFTRNGSVVAVPVVQGLVGLIAHPWVGNDLYLYGGWEHADRAGTPATTGTAVGYGSGALNNTGCDTIGGTCQAETNDLKQIVIGTWQNIYKGSFGRFVVGLQGTYEDRIAFSGVGGAPSTNEFMVFSSIRYYPF
jgi:hypothetical protein